MLKLNQMFGDTRLEVEVEEDGMIKLNTITKYDDDSIGDSTVWLDRGQAHSLMLYLQDYLK